MKPKRKLTLVLLTLILAVLVFPQSAAASGGVALKVGDEISDNVIVMKNTEYSICRGATENVVVSNNKTATDQCIGFFCSADIIDKDNYLKIVAGYNDYDGSKWALSPATKQAKAYEKEYPGETVVAAMNADFYNMQTGQPLGALVMNGKVYNSINYRNFFAVLDDGSAVICDGNGKVISEGKHNGETIELSKGVAEAVGGDRISVRDGKLVDMSADEYGALKYARTAIGIKADGSIVTYVTRGKNLPISYGETYNEVSNKLIKAGCTTVLQLDGGGSATFDSKREGEDKLVVRNSPSDGSERNVSSTLMLVSTAPEDGKFDHASIAPVDEYYTPGSSVEFTAKGVDAYGGAADLPDGCEWTLSEKSKDLGSIDENGIFKSNGKTGVVEAQLVYEGKAAGSTTVYIVEPDTIGFSSSSVSLDFGEKSDLGIYARYKSCDVNLSEGVLKWEIVSKMDGKDPSEIGTMDGNTFIAQSKDQTQQFDCEVNVTYELSDGKKLEDTVKVTIGRMPDILYDFELDENGKALQAAHYSWGMTKDQANGSGPYYFRNYDGDSLEVSTKGSYSGNPEMNTIQEPFVFTGNYDTAVPAADIFRKDGYTFYLWPNASLDDRSVGSADVVNADEGKVRFGEYSLDVEYDFRSYNKTSNSNIYLRYCGEDINIDGTPSELGMWVYAPKGTDNFRIAVCVETWDAAKNSYVTQNIFLKTQDGSDLNYTGIDWEGWKYCYADLSDLGKYVTDEHPMQIKAGSGLVWINYTPMGKDQDGNTVSFGGKSAGHLYFDNMRVVYGAAADDMDDPEIKSVKANGTELKEDGTSVLSSGTVMFYTAFDDPEGDNRSGIKPSETTILVDGVKQKLNDSDETFAQTSCKLANGTHNIRVIVKDVFGNQKSVTREFTVKDKESTAAEISLTGRKSAHIGETYKLTLSNESGLSSMNAVLAIDEEFGEPQVTFADGFDGSATYSEGKLNIKASASKDKSGTIALIKFKVPTSLSDEKSFSYELESCEYTDANGTWTTTLSKKTVKISPYYTIDADVMLEGSEGTIYVKDYEGNPAEDAEVYIVEDGKDDVLIGSTKKDGTLTTDVLCKESGKKFTIYATSEMGYSYRYTGTTAAAAGDKDGKPSQISHNAATDGNTGENITWFANPAAAEHKAVVEYMTEEVYASADKKAESEEGKCTLRQFTQSKEAVLINSVSIKGLESGTTYYYRVGDGKHWSEYDKFSTAGGKDKTTKFFIVGDTQLSGDSEADKSELELLRQIGNGVSAEKVDFGLQTGDFIDNAGYGGYWNEILDAFRESFGATDIVHVMGNHESFGDPTGKTSREVFNIGDSEYYSVEYGDVYIAVIHNNADLKEAAAWLKKDAAASSCQWKLLSVHQPPYYTNAKGGSEGFNEAIPPMAEAAGIQAVFSGHDHSYARTESLREGKKAEKDGITYFICGDLGEKSRAADYKITTEDKFSFAKVTQDYDAIYMLAEADEDALMLTAKDADGTVVDTFTLKSSCADGHDCVYDPETKEAKCRTCGKTIKDYTGFAKDSKGNEYYLIKGTPAKGWIDILDDEDENKTDAYYFDENGVSQKVTLVKDEKSTCTSRGYKLYECSKAPAAERQHQARYARGTGHEYDKDRKCTVCGWQEVSINDCDVSLKYKTYAYKGKAVKPEVTVSYKGKKLNYKYDYKLRYSNNTGFGTGTVSVDPKATYYLNMTENRGSLKAEDPVELTFKIVPQAVSDLKAKTGGNTTVKLSWTGSAGADSYKVYRYNSSKKKYVLSKTVSETSCTVNNLSAGYSYSFKVYAYGKDGDGNTYKSSSVSVKGITRPSTVNNVRLTSSSRAITVKWNKKSGSGYQIRYSTSSSFSSYKSVTVKGPDVNSKKLTNLTKGKKYYVKVRAYKSATGANTAYGNWSTVKNITVK